MMKKTILLTSFEPFDGNSLNSGHEVAKLLPTEMFGAKIIRHLLPTTFGKASEELIKVLDQEHPDVVISLGQAGKRAAVTLERVAINMVDASRPDNDGVRLTDVPVLTGAPAAYFSNLPLRRALEAIRAEGIPVFMSYSAGTYVCNELMYSLLHYVNTSAPSTLAGFVHLPLLPSQAVDKPLGTPSLSAELALQAVKILIRESLNSL